VTDAVLCERGDRVWRITLNRPEKLNALNEAVRRGLHDALTELADRPDVAVVVLAGAGRSFSAGADLSGITPNAAPSPVTTPTDWPTRRHAFGSWQRLLDLFERVPQVTVASLHGHCIGGAALIAAACDLRIAATSLSVRIPEVNIGIPLTWAGLPRLAREIGLPLTRDLVMTGRSMDAAEAHASGFAQRLVADDDLAAATDQLVADLLAQPAGPLALTRAALSAMSRVALGTTSWADADILGWSLTQPDR
jgi:enoyl-CoA hydratase/carnithine racemase